MKAVAYLNEGDGHFFAMGMPCVKWAHSRFPTNWLAAPIARGDPDVRAGNNLS
jgi:hypothetical protein